MQYYFQLGREPKISTAELEAVFSKLGITYQVVFADSKSLIIESKDNIDKKIVDSLGGVIKAGKAVSSQDKTIDTIIKSLTKNTAQGKIVFSLSGENAKRVGIEIKKKLKADGRSARYIEPKNTATILHNKLVEKQSDFTIIKNKVYTTFAIQDIEQFGKRDYMRPKADQKSGMLPPKLARIMVNLAGADADYKLFDPFCGSGTILTEAAVLGYTNLVGSDSSPKAVADTKTNLDWIISQYSLKKIKHNVFLSQTDALDKHLNKKSIDFVVSEPYMGKPLSGRESLRDLRSQAEKLKALYIDTFKVLHKILRPNAVVIFIIPCFYYKQEKNQVNIENEISKIGFKTIEFSKEDKFLLYRRPDQHLGREIWRFKKNKAA